MSEFPATFARDDHRLVALLTEECDRVRPRVARRIPAALRSMLHVDDILQQSCIDAFTSVEKVTFAGRQNFAAWFETIARRNEIDGIRALESHKRGGQATRLPLGGPDDSLSDLLDHLLTTSMTASRQVLRDETLARLRSAIACLPRHYRQAVEQYDLEHQSIEQVADGLGKSVGATYMIRSRAHRMLAEMLQSTSAA